jgi:hypothetical protein
LSLRARIEAALPGDASAIANALLSSARSFIEMAEKLATASCELPLTLDTVGLSPVGPVYIGRLPAASAAPPRHWSAALVIDALISELGFAQPTMRVHSNELIAELAKIARHAGSKKRTEWHLLQRLAALT